MQPSLFSSSTRDLWKRRKSLYHRSPTNWWLVNFALDFFPRVFFLEQRWIGKKTSGEKVDSHDTLTLKVGQKKHRKLRLILNGTGGGHWHFFHVPLDSLKILQQT